MRGEVSNNFLPEVTLSTRKCQHYQSFLAIHCDASFEAVKEFLPLILCLSSQTIKSEDLSHCVCCYNKAKAASLVCSRMQTNADAKLLCSEDLVCPVQVLECVLHVVDGAEHECKRWNGRVRFCDVCSFNRVKYVLAST